MANLAFAAIALAGPGAGLLPREEPLTLRAPSFVWSSSRLSFSLEQKGVLAGKRLAVFVFVDANMVGRVETNGAVTSATIDDLVIPSGKHQLMVKAGTIESRAGFRRLSPVYSLATSAVAALLAGILVARRRGSR
ncbi:MAG: hypothetical protein AB7G12_03740 [Thermoanaerobaculia bacterium]